MAAIRNLLFFLLLFVLPLFSLNQSQVTATMKDGPVLVAANEGYLSLTPTSGRPGTKISVHGYGFVSYEQGMVFFDSNGNGTWDRYSEPFASTSSSIGGRVHQWALDEVVR
jgi:hypothetical protein